MSLETIFDNIDAANASSEAADKAALAAGTLNTDFGAAEASGIYFIPEGDKRLNDKLNYNLAFIMANAGGSSSNFRIIDSHDSPQIKDFLFIDTSKRVSQVDVINSITVAQDYTYSVTLNSSTASYTSGIKQVDILDSFTSVDNTLYRVTLDGVDADYTTGAGETVDQITAGLKSAIDSLGNSVTVVDNSTSITVTANIRGTAFTLTESSADFNAANSVPNHTDTISDIITGIKTQVDTLNKPVTITSDASTVIFTADVPGDAFTLSTDSNLSNSTIAQNFDGVCEITFPTNPENFSEIGIMDYTNTFGSKSPILKSPNKIMGSTSDYQLTIANKSTRFIAINNDWRIL